jgi:TonB-linked outer membrane protein, SusC/RagA family
MRAKIDYFLKFLRGTTLLLLLLISYQANAQVKVTGIVRNDEGSPLENVTVRVKDFNVATKSNEVGQFNLEIKPEHKILVFSSIGYKTMEVPINGRTVININLNASASGLDEVVVMGYSSTRKKDLTGSVGIVNMEDLQKAPVQSFAEALGGRVAGVQVVSPDGKPGSTPNILIRGLGSITQDSRPLYVIDGVPIEDPDNNMIDPADIETMTVLRDASSTAIYGARGANGVIVITTKKGKKGPSVVRYNGYYGVNQPYKYYKLLSPYEFVRLVSDQFGAASNPYLTGGKSLEDYRNVKGTDWQDLLMRTGTSNNHSINISGGDNNTVYSVSANYIKQTGILIASDYTRYQGKLSLDQKVGKRAKVGGMLTYTRNLTTGGDPSPGATSSLFFSAYTYRPIAAPAFAEFPIEDLLYDPQNDAGDYRLNPIISYSNELRNRINKNINGTAYLEYNIARGLKFTTRGSIYSIEMRNEVFNNSKTRSGGPYSSLGINGTVTNISRDVLSNTNLLQYNTLLGANHNITAMIGTDLQETNYKAFAVGATNIPDETLGISGIDAGIVQQNRANATLTKNTLMSGFGRVDYNYAGKYYVTASFRADGSSKFQQHRWGYFPSAAVKWKLSEEKFFKGQSFISDANIRLTYGEAGNNRVGDFDYAAKLDFTSQLYLQGSLVGLNAVTQTLANPELKWETSVQKNLGFDLGFLNNRLNLTVEFYHNKIKDLLYRTPLPGNTGYTSTIKNIASLSNRGMEISLGADLVKNKDFSFSTNFNISFNKNRLDALSDPDEEGILTVVNWEPNFASTPAFISRIGGPLGQIYGYISEGLYQYEDFDKLPNGTYVLKPHVSGSVVQIGRGVPPGAEKYKDINGDGMITDDDKTVIGNGYPIHTGGWSNNFRYKNFDLNIFFQWSYGNDIINANRIWFNGGELTYRSNLGPQNAFAEYVNRWTPTNTNTDIAKIGSNANVYSTRYVEDGSYIRLKTFNLGYRFPTKMMSRYKIKALRIYVAASNLITLTKYKGYDPEVSTYSSGLSPALDYSSYPRPITVTGGINLTL